MRFLITSGGTKVRIDSVRDITNMSRGNFGAKIGIAALNRKHDVHFFHAKDSRTPFKFEYDYYVDGRKDDPVLLTWKMNLFLEECSRSRAAYQQSTFRNYEDYTENLENLVKEYRPHVTLLSAAVSDYLVKPAEGKISGNKDITIELTPAEKVISKVKVWSPHTFLVGFKLLVGATDEVLIEAARKSIVNNQCDLVVANDLNSLRAGKHRIILVTPNNETVVESLHDIFLIDKIEQLMN